MRVHGSEADQKFGGRPRVLVLDGRAARRSSLVQALSQLELSVYGTGSETEAVSLLRTVEWDALFLGMEDVADGLRLVRRASRKALVTVVADTAPTGLVDHTIKAGAMFFLRCTQNQTHLRGAIAVVAAALRSRASVVAAAVPDYAINVGSFLPAPTTEHTVPMLGVA
jgi:DNA-binding NarL/FixJ family response regulator